MKKVEEGREAERGEEIDHHNFAINITSAERRRRSKNLCSCCGKKGEEAEIEVAAAINQNKKKEEDRERERPKFCCQSGLLNGILMPEKNDFFIIKKAILVFVVRIYRHVKILEDANPQIFAFFALYVQSFARSGNTGCGTNW